MDNVAIAENLRFRAPDPVSKKYPSLVETKLMIEIEFLMLKMAIFSGLGEKPEGLDRESPPCFVAAAESFAAIITRQQEMDERHRGAIRG
jgi:hypothetical protein